MKKGLVLLVLLALGACDESMDRQNRYKTYGASTGGNRWPSESEALPRVGGTVAQGDLARDLALSEPPTVSIELLERGRERYDIYCAACHGLTGAGDGYVVARGFPQPAPFSDPRLMEADARRLVDAITRGYGSMVSFSDRVEPADRWAITAYIRALQFSVARKSGAS
jgi:mono/diheme cytochrome c family protein